MLCAVRGANRGAFFALDESHPNHLQPGKRTFHALIPAPLMRDGQPYLPFDREQGHFEGGADPRGDGAAVEY